MLPTLFNAMISAQTLPPSAGLASMTLGQMWPVLLGTLAGFGAMSAAAVRLYTNKRKLDDALPKAEAVEQFHSLESAIKDLGYTYDARLRDVEAKAAMRCETHQHEMANALHQRATKGDLMEQQLELRELAKTVNSLGGRIDAVAQQVATLSENLGEKLSELKEMMKSHLNKSREPQR